MKFSMKLTLNESNYSIYFKSDWTILTSYTVYLACAYVILELWFSEPKRNLER